MPLIEERRKKQLMNEGIRWKNVVVPVCTWMFAYFDWYFHLNHVNEWKQVELNSMNWNQVHVIDSLLR